MLEANFILSPARKFPLLEKEGWMRDQENIAKQP
jgi:hypothetical protein